MIIYIKSINNVETTVRKPKKKKNTIFLYYFVNSKIQEMKKLKVKFQVLDFFFIIFLFIVNINL